VSAICTLLTKDRAGFFPGAIYLCSYWYMPKDLATRISYFYCASALSGAFSGLLAAAIAKMDGVGGYEGWRWIFLLEGIVTVALGVSCFFLLIDSPALSGRWLKPDEIRFLELQRFIKDGGRFGEEKQESFKWSDLKAVLCNWRLYMQAYILLCISACSYGTYNLE
jgi:MFS family permease